MSEGVSPPVVYHSLPVGMNAVRTFNGRELFVQIISTKRCKKEHFSFFFWNLLRYSMILNETISHLAMSELSVTCRIP